jgi:hypothetical protein
LNNLKRYDLLGDCYETLLAKDHKNGIYGLGLVNALLGGRSLDEAMERMESILAPDGKWRNVTGANRKELKKLLDMMKQNKELAIESPLVSGLSLKSFQQPPKAPDLAIMVHTAGCDVGMVDRKGETMNALKPYQKKKQVWFSLSPQGAKRYLVGRLSDQTYALIVIKEKPLDQMVEGTVSVIPHWGTKTSQSQRYSFTIPEGKSYVYVADIQVKTVIVGYRYE